MNTHSQEPIQRMWIIGQIDIQKKQHELYRNQLGNLTLTDQNIHLFNKPFDQKKELYKNSIWQIERDLGRDYNNWTIDEIMNRGRKMIKFAKIRWKI